MGRLNIRTQLGSAMEPVDLEGLSGTTVGVDANQWLHRGALQDAEKHLTGVPTKSHIEYIIGRVNYLMERNIQPLLVFDGIRLPIKAHIRAERKRMNKNKLKLAKELESAGNHKAAIKAYKQAVEVTPHMLDDVVQKLKEKNILFLIAPYEADSQLAYLARNGIIQTVITDDADLIIFGCPRILFNMDNDYDGDIYVASEFKNCTYFKGLNEEMFLHMCILIGCDYLKGIIDHKRARDMIRDHKSYDKVLKEIRKQKFMKAFRSRFTNKRKNQESCIPHGYEVDFKKALWIYKHSTVYDTILQKTVHLSPINEEVSFRIDFLGPMIPNHLVRDMVKGINPIDRALGSNWESLFSRVLSLSDETPPPPSPPSPPRNLSEEELEWFWEAMQSQTDFVVKRKKEIAIFMKTHADRLESEGVTLAVIKDMLDEWFKEAREAMQYQTHFVVKRKLRKKKITPADRLGSEGVILADIKDMLDELQDLMESIDNPYYRHLFSPLVPFIRYMENKIANAMQSQDYDYVVQRMKKITLVLKNPADILGSQGVTTVYIEDMLDELQKHVEFIENANDLHSIDSLVALLDHSKSTHPSILAKATEIVTTIVQNHPRTNIMMHLISSDDAEVREAALRCLLGLAKDNEGGNNGQVTSDDKVKQVLQQRIEGISAMALEDLGATREERQLVDSLWNACDNEPSSLREKGLLVLPGEDAPPPDGASKLMELPLGAWAAAESANRNSNSVGEKKEAQGVSSSAIKDTLDDLQEHIASIYWANELIHDNKTHITAFRLKNGYAQLRDALMSESVRFQRKALNFIQYLLHENSSDCNKVIKLGFPRIMMRMESSDDAEVREAALRVLLVLAKDNEGGNNGQVNNDDKLKQVLQQIVGISAEDLGAARKKRQHLDSLWNPNKLNQVLQQIEGISAMAPEDLGAAREVRQLVDSLWNACYNEPSSLREKKGLLVLPGEDAPPADIACKLFEPP